MGSSTQSSGFGRDHRVIGSEHHSATPRPGASPLVCPQCLGENCKGKLPDQVCELAEPWDDYQNDSDLPQSPSGLFSHTLGRPRVTPENVLAGLPQADTIAPLLKQLRDT